MEIKILPYDPTMKDQWNTFVEQSNNGTFLFNRNYMDYHADRFQDASLVVEYHSQDKNGIVGLLPATIKEDTVTSHGGLTYGGLISQAPSGLYIGRVISAILDYYKNLNLVWKPVPFIYHKVPTETEEFWVTYSGFSQVKSQLSAYLTEKTSRYRDPRKTRITTTAMKKYSTIFGSCPERLPEFWEILSQNLLSRHKTTPVHSLEEIQMLQNRFPNNIKFYYVVYQDKIAYAMIMYLNRNVHHIQYFAGTPTGHQLSLGNVLVQHYLNMLSSDLDWIVDFGISNERDGTLNEGLHRWKSEFGCADVLYRTYERRV